MPKKKVIFEKPEDTSKWLVTFNDLMTLLLTFFVLILSMSTLDAKKVKDFQSSLLAALGALEAGGDPEQTLIEMIREVTRIGKRLKLMKNIDPASKAKSKQSNETQKTSTDEELPLSSELLKEFLSLQEEGLEKIAENEEVVVFKKLKDILMNEYYEPGLLVKQEKRGIVLSFPDKVLFAPGKVLPKQEVQPILDNIGSIFKNKSFDICVEGHTDDMPIHTEQYPSNWELSVARSVGVAKNLIELSSLDPARFAVAGYADSKPIVPNTSDEQRAQNRRVEIVLIK
jgi:chemotaxis protein MotB